MKPKTLAVVQNEDNPVPVEVMAANIVDIAQGIKKLRSGPLNDKALLLLIQHSIPYGRVSRETIRDVLDGVGSLEKTYLVPKKEPQRK